MSGQATTQTTTKATNQATIREATAADLPACAAIINNWIDATDWMERGPSRETIKDAFAAEMFDSRTFFVACRDEKIVGYLAIEKAMNHIHGFYLAPQERSNGTGKALLDHAKATNEWLTLVVDPENGGAQRFYEREGFITNITTRYERDEDHNDIPMRWDRAA